MDDRDPSESAGAQTADDSVASTNQHWLEPPISVGLFMGFTLLAWVLQTDGFGLLDWDTYARIRFLDVYDERLVDTHLLYHGVVLRLMSFGWTPLEAIRLLNGVAYGLFVALVYWTSRSSGLSRKKTGVMLLLAVLGSPGLVALLLSLEDNVTYFPVLLLVLYWMPRATDGVARNLRIGAYAGVALAIGMLLSISLLFLLFTLLAAPVLAVVGRRDHALRIVAMVAVALGVYYLVHVVFFSESPVALHPMFLKALGLKDFEQSTTPLWSLARLQQAFGGFRAVSWLPTLHFMWMRDGVRDTVYFIPWLLTGAYLGVAGYHVAVQRAWLAARWRELLVALAFYGLILVFPFLYEPYLIERWDIFWIGLLLLSARLLAFPMPRWTQVFLAVMVCTHVAASLLVITNHYGMTVGPFHQGWRLKNGRQYVRFVKQHDVDVLFFPVEVDAMQTAYVLHNVHPRVIFLVKREGHRTSYLRFNMQGHAQRSALAMWRIVSRARRVNLDPKIQRRVLRDFHRFGYRGSPRLLFFRPR